MNNNIKIANENNNFKSPNNEINRNKQNLLWCNSPLNKKINTYENLFYKKTFDKYVPVRDKLLPDKNGIILPDLKNINNSNNRFNNYESLNTRKPFNSQRINLRSISTDKAKLQQNINSITNDTSAFTHSSKKYFSPGAFGSKNYTEDLSKFRMGLLSAGSTSNNNIIIPMIPMKRPVSNFNFGGGQLWNNLDNNNKNMIDKPVMIDENKNESNNNNLKKEEKQIIFDVEFNKNEINMNLNNSKKDYNKSDYSNSNNIEKNKNLKSQDMKRSYNAFQAKSDINNINKVYIGIDNIITKLHKIKIEKGMMNSEIVNSLNKNFNYDYQNQIEQFKKSHLPKVFNNQADKKKIKI